MQKTKTETHQAGFTLIEVIAVLVIIAIVAAVAISKGISTSKVSVTSEANILKTHLRFAQIKAMGATVSWGINISSGSYTLQSNGATATINLPGETSPTHTFSGGVTATAPATNPITFSTLGIPVNSTGNNLTANLTITLAQGSSTQTVTVTQYTGFLQ